MKSILKLFLIGMVCITLRADMLRLRDGRLITGQFLGATRTEIWFKDDVPGDVMGAAAYPVEAVESLTFGPAPGQSKSIHSTKKPVGATARHASSKRAD